MMINAGYTTQGLRVIRPAPQGSRAGLSVVADATQRALVQAGIGRGGLGNLCSSQRAQTAGAVLGAAEQIAAGFMSGSSNKSVADWGAKIGASGGVTGAINSICTATQGQAGGTGAPLSSTSGDAQIQALLAQQQNTLNAQLAMYQAQSAQQQQQTAAQQQAAAAKQRTYLMVGGAVALGVVALLVLKRK